ncbi:MAG: DUF6691 family protein [Wenzhouxiangellaceae bacterium]|nr:DUF6691 family protein [Wenzhouxiangellaceae bacterium]
MNRLQGSRWIALFGGVLFGAGLSVSQMLDPAKVLAFLDLFGDWDPSLALVMLAALATMAPAWRIQRAYDHNDDHNPPAPAITRIDARLLVGACLFGLGWGLVGYCPGPALASLALFSAKPVVFVIAMLAGMGLHHWLARSTLGSSSSAPM